MLPPLSFDSNLQAWSLSRRDFPVGWLRIAATTSGVRYLSQAVAPLAIQPRGAAARLLAAALLLAGPA